MSSEKVRPIFSPNLNLGQELRIGKACVASETSGNLRRILQIRAERERQREPQIELPELESESTARGDP